jgi:hypothetical protein
VGPRAVEIAAPQRSVMAKNIMEWWLHRTEEEGNEIREALRKHGPSSKDYNDLSIVLFLNCEVVRQALLERYRVQGTSLPLQLARKLRKFLTTDIAC